MRDNLCDEENLIEEMKFRKEWIEENILKLQQLEQDKKIIFRDFQVRMMK